MILVSFKSFSSIIQKIFVVFLYILCARFTDCIALIERYIPQRVGDGLLAKTVSIKKSDQTIFAIFDEIVQVLVK